MAAFNCTRTILFPRRSAPVMFALAWNVAAPAAAFLPSKQSKLGSRRSCCSSSGRVLAPAMGSASTLNGTPRPGRGGSRGEPGGAGGSSPVRETRTCHWVYATPTSARKLPVRRRFRIVHARQIKLLPTPRLLLFRTFVCRLSRCSCSSNYSLVHRAFSL